VVVSVHPLTQELPLKVLEDVDRSEGCGGRETPFVTVVTDLGSASATWFSPEADIT
jgi:1,2-diacylglycerol 3-beta-galactosyltransferase